MPATSWTVRVAGPAERSLAKHVQPKDRARILEAMDQMRQNPFAGDVVRLKDYPIAYRRRVGSWRILFDVDGDARIVTVQEVARRTSRTYS